MNAQEIIEWILDGIKDDKYILDLRQETQRTISNGITSYVVHAPEKPYILNINDVVIQTSSKIMIVDQQLFMQLFIPTTYGEYAWDNTYGTIFRREELYESYCHFTLMGMIKYLEASSDINNPFPTEAGNWQGVTVTVPVECTDQVNYPKIYVDDSTTPLYEGLINIPTEHDGKFNMYMRFDPMDTTHRYDFVWSKQHSDTVVFDASKTAILTKEETDNL